MIKKTLLLFCVLSALLTSAQWQGGKFNWRDVKTVAPGIVRAEWKFKSPRLIRVFALRVDLRTPGLRFHVTPRDEKYGQPMPDAPECIIRTRRTTTRDFFNSLRKKNFRMAAAVNATPWRPWKSPFTHTYADQMGFLVSDGDVVMPPDGKRPSLVITKEGKADLITVKPEDDISQIVNAVSGFSFVLKNGKLAGGNKALAPRTGYGLSQDRRYLYIFVADGRQPKYSMGMTHQEVGSFLQYLGADTGVNMDGGGSSTLIVRKGSKAQMLNKQPGGGERKVAASLGISISR